MNAIEQSINKIPTAQEAKQRAWAYEDLNKLEYKSEFYKNISETIGQAIKESASEVCLPAVNLDEFDWLQEIIPHLREKGYSVDLRMDKNTVVYFLIVKW